MSEQRGEEKTGGEGRRGSVPHGLVIRNITLLLLLHR